MELQDYLQGFRPKPIGGKSSYAVFVPIVEVDSVPSLLYEIRSSSMRRQPSEICFPGGRMDQGESPCETAVRELEEEIGVSPWEVYGQIDYLVQRTGQIIYPVLGRLGSDLSYTLSKEEVSEVFTVPISHLLTQKEEYFLDIVPKPSFSKDVLGLGQEYPFRRGRESFAVYRYEGRIIWGITGSITREVLSVLQHCDSRDC